ncbi:MAG: 5-(carboxyamino)imidazole ribonucleotide mutase [Firmicutes bacterium HGW-Firmicutes-4]|jgi:5-(carboxyamino)imidazole ribonucleotide mutase|nr:MAG: 5-(carboxyamino)imidazole ribonucleotide mutase [Firmicutes bacterium HGW-Firmicutes-4]
MIEKKKHSAAPMVGIIMGSKSDLRVMSETVLIMEKCQIPYEIKVVSAHRTPDRMVEYAKNAEQRSIEVIIAGAGGSAHLPGMVSALTVLPVIGVPVKLAELDGLDSLLSIVQMPKGVPVATVGINNARNAGILAARILAIKYPEIRTKLESYVISEKEKVGYDLEDEVKEILNPADKNEHNQPS